MTHEKAPKLSWNSAKILQVKEEWETLYRSWDGRSWDKSNYSERWGMLDAIFTKRLSDADLRDLAASCAALPAAETDWSEFQRALFDEMAWVFLRKGDRDSLINLLSTRCPSTIDLYKPEYWLVLKGNMVKLKDPILILADAYARCRLPETRRDIAARFRDAFTASGVSGSNDDEFVKNAVKFYNNNAQHLQLNDTYDALYHAGLLPDNYDELLKTNPLFVRAESGTSEKRGHD